ncbi:unnamed protein product, partial [marine sediment metagenome]
DRGNIILQNIPNSEHPSILEASMSSSGMVKIFWRRKKIPELIIIKGKIIP